MTLAVAEATGYKAVDAPNGASPLWTVLEFQTEKEKGRDLLLFSPRDAGKTGSRNFIVLELNGH